MATNEKFQQFLEDAKQMGVWLLFFQEEKKKLPLKLLPEVNNDENREKTAGLCCSRTSSGFRTGRS